MSSTDPLAQRYMRALAHIPLLSMDSPNGSWSSASGSATRHTRQRFTRRSSASMSSTSPRHVLDHASYFSETNGNVLTHPRVVVLRERRTPASADAAERPPTT